MTEKSVYQSEVQKLSQAIDFAIDAFTKHCPDHFTDDFLTHTIDTYLDCKVSFLAPNREDKTVEPLNYETEIVFAYFQEGAGPTVEYFWNKINEEKLGYKRADRLDSILQRGFIADSFDFHYVVDALLVPQKLSMKSRIDTLRLSQMLENYVDNRRAKAIA